ncbi:Mor transcription activator family protein [Rivihabitans pingtungensis]|uniref:Mor transcription activator family protein n=1 Tax=Rivihabitans pingtungensis TaxID=1054498 RepID=A0A318KR37_9NEIS|nr:Mor transcription activator family protein [Rivihabitans pingtungensis]PXX79258.1 Mor transcription activator family protein [Rivihabitans pingtungensis]
MTPQHLTQVQHLLPASAQTLAELIGLPATLKLVSELGGRTWSFVKHQRNPREEGDALAQIVGEREAELLTHHFAGDADVHIPLCKAALRELRDREIRARFDEMTMEHHYSARQAVAELAGCYGIASRHVWRLLKQADKEPGTRPLN